MADQDESLVTRRSRRITAGNRMDAALAEMALDDLSNEPEDDIDFINEKDEEDVFDKDFESTDDEGAQEDVEAGDKIVQEEEKREKKAARTRVAKSTALAHARNKSTFNPQAQKDLDSQTETKVKRRVSLGVAINAETGEIIELSASANKRQSQRKHTILNTSETVIRMKKSQAKRAAASPKKMKSESRLLTQDELIARALDNEEGNIVEHRDYLKLEEEKRKRARVVRAAVEGPLLRWVSRTEEITVSVDPPVPPSTPAGHTYAYASMTPYGVPGGSIFTAAGPYRPSNVQYYPKVTAPIMDAKTGATQSHATPSLSSHLTPALAPEPIPAEPTTRTEKVANNYVVHELGQFETVPKPPWHETMKAMFGDHPWEDLRVFVGRNRPLARPKQMCPITGRPARYLDPRTGVPYADLSAFRTLTRMLAHEYVWSDSFGCYVGREGDVNARGVTVAAMQGSESGVGGGVEEAVSMDVR